MKASPHVVRNLCLAGTLLALLLAGCSLPGQESGTLPGKPAVAIVAPVNDSQVTVNQPLTIQVTASDAQGVTRIEVKVDGILIGTAQSTADPGQATLDSTNIWVFGQAGSHAVEARAFNAAGQASDPAVVSLVAVAEAAGQPPAAPTLVPPAAEGEPEAIAPCSVLTQAEAETILAEPAGPAQEMEGGCAYNNASDSLYVVSVGPAQGEKRAEIAEGLLFVLGMAGLPLDEEHLAQFQALAEAQDYAGFFAEAVAAAQGVPAIKSQLLDGLGDVGYWAWIEAGERRQGALVINRGETMVNVNLVVAAGRDEQALLEAAKTVALAVFDRLPARFTIGAAVPAEEPAAQAGAMASIPGAPTIQSFTAEPLTIAGGGSTTLSWAIDGATRVEIDQGIGVVEGSGSYQVSPVETTTYILSAWGISNTVSTQTLTVPVN